MSLSGHIRACKGDFVLDARFSFAGSGVSALFGPSGAGKTTMLRAIAGLERFPDTRLSFADTVWQDEREFLPPEKRSVGYVFQEASLFTHLDVRRNLEYGFRRSGKSRARISLDHLVDLFRLESLLPRKPDSLSGGERQRVSMARALAASPGLLLMDEPLAGLDEERRAEVLRYLDALVRELDVPMIYVSHSADEVAMLADSLVYLDGGRVRGSGAVAEMFSRTDLALSHRREAESVIEAVAVAYDERFQLNALEFSGGTVQVPGERLSIGRRFRLRVAARDVSLTLSEPRDTSILNIFEAKVDECMSSGGAREVVRLDVNGTFLLAHLTRKSVVRLGLERGRRVYAQVKSVAVLA